jgi:hypothetical protein
MLTRQTHFEKVSLDEIRAIIAKEETKPKAEVPSVLRKKRRKGSARRVVSARKGGVG